MTAIASAASIRLLDGFHNPAASSERWDALAHQFNPGSVFATSAWLSSWWQAFGRGQLLLVAAERNGRTEAIAPLFADGGMIFPVGSGGSDELNVVGHVSDADLLARMLQAAMDRVPAFCGIRFYLLPERSPTRALLSTAASLLGLRCYVEDDLPAPVMTISDDRDVALAGTRKKSMIRHERSLLRDGELAIHHDRRARDILPHLPALFAQHVARWSHTATPSRFAVPAHRRFVEEIVRTGSDAGWVRFTRLEWRGRSIACHLGFCLDGRYLWYTPTYDVELARYSPGEVLLRHVLLDAIDEGAELFDFGIGDELYKARFATDVKRVTTFGLYPPSVVPKVAAQGAGSG
jgi:CelD/BcsL family acetyltransferase involved in cellulose biosynthesis